MRPQLTVNSKNENTSKTGLLEGAMVCHQGLVRKNNQDAILVLEDEDIYVLADSMGGHAGGEVASRIAVETTARELRGGAGLTTAVLSANREIKAAAESGEGSRDMGTTIVAVLMDGNSFQLAWVGDSRAYRINGGIEQVTTDHSLVQELVSHGVISAKKAATHPKRNILSRALGIMEDSEELVGVREGELEAGEFLLLCSDGLHGLVADRRIRRAVVHSNSPHQAVTRLLQAALEAGGTDNVSAILLSPGPAGAKRPGSFLSGLARSLQAASNRKPATEGE